MKLQKKTDPKAKIGTIITFLYWTDSLSAIMAPQSVRLFFVMVIGTTKELNIITYRHLVDNESPQTNVKTYM